MSNVSVDIGRHSMLISDNAQPLSARAMYKERRRRSLHAVVTGIAATCAGACKFASACSLAEYRKDPRVVDWTYRSPAAWCRIPEHFNQVWGRYMSKNGDLDHFFVAVVSGLRGAEDCFATRSYDELVEACQHALGDNVLVEMVGSLTRQTASFKDCDVDFQVRRIPGSEQADELFTDTDKRKVAQNLEKLHCVTGPVTIGNVAIKFTMEVPVDLVLANPQLPVDLVLANPRLEEFPKLRGGDNFYENSARINQFLKENFAARLAIIGVKQFFYWRPKGLLLEAVVWRLSKTFPLRKITHEPAGPQEMKYLRKECFTCFGHLLAALKNWEKSPFGRDLKEDLDMLPERKREEHIQSFKAIRFVSREELGCLLFIHAFLGLNSHLK